MTDGRLILIRHGETEWSRNGRHTGRTDIPLTSDGEARARTLVDRLMTFDPALVLCSPLERARRTAELAGLTPSALVDDLLEWDYGDWEGITTPQIREQLGDPSWTIWARPIPGGEQAEDVAVRTARVIRRVLPILGEGRDAVLVAHGHLLRILTATWLGLPAVDGRLWILDAGSVSLLGYERDQRAIVAWNT
jgi:broad specificity phosphatase PhoE